MNIFPPRPDSAEKAVSSLQWLIIGHSAYQTGLYVAMSDHFNNQLQFGQKNILILRGVLLLMENVCAGKQH